MKSGRRLGIDFGDVRIGLAISDSSGLLASPLSTLNNVGIDTVVSEIVDLAEEYEIAAIYVGLPIHLSGTEGSAAIKAREFAAELQAHMPDDIEIRCVDERLSTSQAERESLSLGKKISKDNIDQLAAVVILESAIQAERVQGMWAGKPVSDL